MKNVAIVVVLILGAFAISANIENQTKIGYVDKEHILSQMEEMQKLKRIEESFQSDKSRELDKLDFQIAEIFSQIETIRTVKGIGSYDEEQLTIKMNMYKKDKLDLKNELTEELDLQKKEILDQALVRLDMGIKTISEKKDYTHIFNKPKLGDSELLVAPEESDLTVAVMDYLELKTDSYLKIEKKR